MNILQQSLLYKLRTVMASQLPVTAANMFSARSSNCIIVEVTCWDRSGAAHAAFRCEILIWQEPWYYTNNRLLQHESKEVTWLDCRFWILHRSCPCMQSVGRRRNVTEQVNVLEVHEELDQLYSSTDVHTECSCPGWVQSLNCWWLEWLPLWLITLTISLLSVWMGTSENLWYRSVRVRNHLS